MGRGQLAGAVGAYGLSVALAAVVLPGRVPLHFDAGGDPDRFGSRTEAMAMFALLGLFLLALHAGARAAAARAGLGSVNVPHPEYWKTPEREPELRRRMGEDMDQVFAATFLLCTAIVLSTVWAAADHGDGGLPLLAPAALAVYLLWIAVWCYRLAAQRYRPPP